MDKKLDPDSKPKTELITEDIKKILKETFEELRDDVVIEVFTGKGTNDVFNETLTGLVKVLAEISPKIKASFYTLGDEHSGERGVTKSPTLLVAPDKYRIRFTGAPLGEEGRSLILAILMASTGSVVISEKSLKRLMEIDTKREIQVFVSPTCPYCPQEVAYAVSAAIARRDFVSAEVIEIFENRDIAEKFGIVSVPQTFINGILTSPGAEPEDYFVESLLSLKRPEVVPTEVSDVPVEKDLVVVGAGPAGMTAAIYAERAGLKTVILERENIGGQVTITPEVENYPGFTRIPGKTLVDMMAQQAAQYSEIHLSEEVKEIESVDGRFQIKSNWAIYRTKGIIIATGVANKRLDVPGESRLYGRGVSYCAECDGYFFKDGKKVIVVGGGNTAATYALYLNTLGAKVTLIHRREALRCEMRLQESMTRDGIDILWNSEVKEILGDKVVTGVKIEDKKEKVVKEMAVDGVFVAIGYIPNNEVAKMLGLGIDEEGYIKVDEHRRTSVPMVYAAGDITGGVKQIVVAVGEGSQAALTAFEDLETPYWVEKK
ncbi:MAG TPA: FAD-dependent oxidoreductase [Thermodesulfovibrionales bacterium]|nr:FAD-dependent oxidoreductase [Thermodesulfovibrionales bacterium]